MTKRLAISKGLRFDIFRRDSFICQYCGAKPPDVVLEIDHITPVVEGGTNDQMNLVTSCEACNRGKGKKQIDPVARPDADLAWLEAQQELVELRRYQEVLKEQNRIRRDLVGDFQDFWQDISGLDWAPTESVILQWMSKYDPWIIERAIVVVAKKVGEGDLWHGWPKYIWGVMRNIEDDEH